MIIHCLYLLYIIDGCQLVPAKSIAYEFVHSSVPKAEEQIQQFRNYTTTAFKCSSANTIKIYYAIFHVTKYYLKERFVFYHKLTYIISPYKHEFNLKLHFCIKNVYYLVSGNVIFIMLQLLIFYIHKIFKN